jgi:hypothetical protein
MDSEFQWVPLEAEELHRVSDIIKRVFVGVVISLVLAMAITATFFRDGLGLSESAGYDPAGAVYRSHDTATNVRCADAQTGGWACTYHADGQSCEATIFDGQRAIAVPNCRPQR